MKRTFPLPIGFLLITAALLAGAGTRYDAKTWGAVQTYDLATLSQNFESHTRELLGVKCNFRGKDIHHMKPNWYESSIWQPIPGQRGKFAHVSVMVAKQDLSAFKSLPTDSAGPEITLYGRVEYEIASNFRFLRLVGRNVSVDSAGNAAVSW
jgi:hypothetical protein